MRFLLVSSSVRLDPVQDSAMGSMTISSMESMSAPEASQQELRGRGPKADILLSC